MAKNEECLHELVSVEVAAYRHFKLGFIALEVFCEMCPKSAITWVERPSREDFK